MQQATAVLGSPSWQSILESLSIAVLVPCFNEEKSLPSVVRDFRLAVPAATIYVYDNNSTDQTWQVARDASVIARKEKLQGKGNVVRRMFADIEADIYILVDGDATYDAASAPQLMQALVAENLDMVVGRRISTDSNTAYRRGHVLGNALLSKLVAWLFGAGFDDMLSGYRVLSRRFVKSFPALTWGFEIETELTVHALELKMPCTEFVTPYRARLDGSTSKLKTYRDGFQILLRIAKLLKNERPLLFFSTAAAILVAVSLGLVWPVFQTYFATGLVPRLPTAILATGTMLLAFLSLACGLILDTVTHGRREAKRLAYLALPAVGSKRK